MKTLVITLTLLFCLAIGCSSDSVVTQTPDPIPVQTPTIHVMIVTATPTNTPNIPPTYTPMPTYTPYPTPTDYPTPIPTTPPLPTTIPTQIPVPTPIPTATPADIPITEGTPTPIPTPYGERPLLFNQFSGAVTIGGIQPEDGTLIEARMQWWISNPSKVYQGTYGPIIVTPNDWALNSGIITFHVGELQALETAIYNGRAFQVATVNLTFP